MTAATDDALTQAKILPIKAATWSAHFFETATEGRQTEGRTTLFDLLP
jgi:hypothetical protein